MDDGLLGGGLLQGWVGWWRSSTYSRGTQSHTGTLMARILLYLLHSNTQAIISYTSGDIIYSKGHYSVILRHNFYHHTVCFLVEGAATLP